MTTTRLAPLDIAPNPQVAAHLAEAARVLALPLVENGLHWHPFGVYGVPLARRVVGDQAWVRRLHVWHPEAHPVGPTSPYGVHTHSGRASSHVLAGALHHHLYAFQPDPDGVWRRASRLGAAQESLVAHVVGTTTAGATHTFPALHAHGVGKPPGFAISLFEQREEGRQAPFTTWTRTDAPPETLVESPPVAPQQVLREARAVLEEALFAFG